MTRAAWVIVGIFVLTCATVALHLNGVDRDMVRFGAQQVSTASLVVLVFVLMCTAFKVVLVSIENRRGVIGPSQGSLGGRLFNLGPIATPFVEAFTAYTFFYTGATVLAITLGGELRLGGKPVDGEGRYLVALMMLVLVGAAGTQVANLVRSIWTSPALKAAATVVPAPASDEDKA